MHARVIHANISDVAEAKRGLDEEVIRGIKGGTRFPGCLRSYRRLARDLDRGVRSRRAARATAPAEGAEAPA